jgi:hypothetical protein
MQIWLDILIFIIGVSFGLSATVLLGLHRLQALFTGTVSNFQTIIDSQLRRIKQLEYDLERARGRPRNVPNKKRSYRPKGSQNRKGHARNQST